MAAVDMVDIIAMEVAMEVVVEDGMAVQDIKQLPSTGQDTSFIQIPFKQFI